MALTDIEAGRLADNVFNVTGTNKNRIINGAMQVSQRNGTSSVSETGSGQYTLDRWQVAGSSAAGVFSVEQSTDTPTGYINSLKVTVTTSSAASNADESYQLQQHIEGLNCGDLSFGSANAKTVTLSFWVKSSVTGTMGGVLRNANYNRTYPYEYTISSANTWEQKTITIPGDTTGTWLTTNNIGLSVQFGFGAGTNRQATANTWANTVARIPSGSTQLIATNGATWFVTGVQLEVGSVATPFEHRSYGDELASCQRYYWNLLLEKGQTDLYLGNATQYNSSTIFMTIHPPVTMRTEPSADISNGTNHFATLANNAATDFNTWGLDGRSGAAAITVNATVSGTSGDSLFVRSQNTAATFAFTAEL